MPIGTRILLASALALILAACTGDSTPPPPEATPTATATPTPTRTSTPTPTPTPPPPSVTIAFIGDLMLDRDVEWAIEHEGPEYTFERVLPLFDGADLVVGNLEGSLSLGGEPLEKQYQFQTDPALALTALHAGGIGAISLANNHATDYGLEGLAQTLDALDGIPHWGAGMIESTAREPAIVTMADAKAATDGELGLTFAFLGYSDVGETILADGSRGGVARAEVENMRADIAAARARSDVDFVVVTLHHGTEYTHEPTDRQRELSRAAIDAGADIVVGHHPHALQPIEEYRAGLIFYSLGNFVFDLDREDLEVIGPMPFQSVVAAVTFERGRRPQVDLRPAWIDPDENRPRPATEAEAAVILDLLRPRAIRDAQ